MGGYPDPSRQLLRNPLLWFGPLLAAVLVASWYCIQWFAGYGEGLERRALLVTASTAAASFDGTSIASLTGSAEDLGTPAFTKAREELRRLRGAIPGARFAYLMMLRHGEVIFLADAEPAGSADYSAPGDVYREASPALRLVFATGTAATEGPLSDHWGEWVSGLAPIPDPKTGQIVSVFGVDVSAGSWRATVAGFRWIGIATTGFLVAVILFFCLLALSQERLRTKLSVANRILENGTAVLYRLGAGPSFPMTFISNNIAKLGYEPQELLAAPDFYRSLVHPDDRDRIEAFNTRLVADGAGAASIQFRIRAKDGTFRWFDNDVSPIRDNAGRLMAVEGLLFDITERKLAEAKIRENEATIHGLVEQGISGIFIVSEDGKIAYVNPLFAKMIGYDAALDSIGHPLIDFIADADKQSVRDAMAALLSGKQSSVEVSVAVLHKQGGTFDALAQGTVTTFHGKRSIIGVIMDITKRKQAEKKLLFANTLLTTAMDISPDAILVVDAQARIISSNRRFGTMWNIPADVLDAGDDGPVLAAVTSAMKDQAAFLVRVKYLYAHPEETGHDELETIDGRFIDRHTAVLQTATGQYLGRVWFFRDVTARKLAEAEIRHTSRHDTLTGLANRRVFIETVQHAIARANRGDRSFAVLYLDLDHFKDVNDTLGHPVGDELLCSVADRLTRHARQTDVVARFGGDEFAVFAAIDEPADAANLAEKLVKAIGTPFSIQGNDIRSSASIGIAVREPGDTPETLLSHADVALYRAKADGRAGYRFFTDAMDAEVRARVTLTAELGEAINSGQFFLQYQPQIEVETGNFVGVEALVRWRHPLRGVLGPGEFVLVAEKTGLIVPLDRWVKREACRQAKAWLDAGIDSIVVTVNVSGAQFKRVAELEKDVAIVLAESSLPPQHLELELTETVLMEASREHADVLDRLRQMGVRIAIDDFGTGYSSLDYLRRYPADRVKIAQDFVRLITIDPGSAIIVKATIGLARELGMMAIAEGVETAEQYELLKSWGCRQMQGYFFARPLDAEDLLPLLRRGRILADSAVAAKTAA